MCAIAHAYATLNAVYLFSTSMGQRERQIQENPSELFTIATNSMFAFAFVIYIHITWFKRDGLANLYNVCHNNDHFRVPKRTKANSVVYKVRSYT